MLSVGLLSGGYGEAELARAGAFRIYRDPADLHRSLDELGVLPKARGTRPPRYLYPPLGYTCRTLPCGPRKSLED